MTSPPTKLCLVVGCINRYPAPEGWRYCHVDAVDRPIYDAAEDRLVRPDYVADVRALPFRDASADRVQLWDVIEHLAEPDAFEALRELRRVLRPGGELDVQAPDVDVAARWYAEGRLDLRGLRQIFYGERLPNQQEADYHRFGWTSRELRDALEAEGFEAGEDLGGGTVVARFRAVRR